MSDSILRKIHGNRIWRKDPFSSLRDIKIVIPDTDGDSFQYMVFNVPLKYLRSGCTSFIDFKKTGKAQAYKNSLLVFLKLIELCSTSGKDTRGSNCACFIETVMRNGFSIGFRIWFFSNRKETELHLCLIKLIMDNNNDYEKQQKLTPKLQVKLASHMGHLTCKSLFDYIKCCSNYNDNEVFMTECEDIHEKIRFKEYKLHPSNVFSVESTGFSYSCLVGQQFEQNDHKKYFNGSEFTFPNEEHVLRVSTEQITVDELWLKKKYIPSYFFEKVRLPAVEAKEYEEGGNAYVKLVVPDHVHQYKKINDQPLIRLLEEMSNSDTHLEYDNEHFLGEVQPLVRQAFVVTYIDHTSNVSIFTDKGVSKWLQYAPRYLPKQELSDQWFTDMLTDMKRDPETKTLLADKNSLDALDTMKYTCELLQEYDITNMQKFKEKMMDNFYQNIVLDVDANVSEPIQMMLLWFHKKYNHRMFIHRKKTDPNGSVFLNSMAWRLNFFDEDLQVSTGHPTLMLLTSGRLDAYRQELNLHLNIIFTGEGATSKSFLFEKMKQMSIPGTISELTYQTKRANAVDHDENDLIVVFNEAPQGMFMSNLKSMQKSDGEQEAAFKEKLTSQITKCKTFVKDPETDERTNRMVISQSIGVYHGATNDDPSTCNEAMQTRFYWGEFEKCERKNKSIDECMRGEREWQQVGDKALKRSLHYFHLEQFQMMLLFKLMFIGIIKYPTLDVSDLVYAQLQKSLRGQKIETSTRYKERFDIVCIIFTMINALDTVYNYEGGEQYNQPFDPRTLLDLEPYLYCTEEIAIFAFTLLSNEIYNPSETKILKAVWKLWKQKGGKDYEKKITQDGTVDYAYDFIKLDKSGKKLRMQISQAIPNHHGRPSDFNIKAALKKLKSKSLPSYPMMLASNVDERYKEYRDGSPEREPGSVSTTLTDGMKEDTDAYFNIQLFHLIRKGEDIDPIGKAVQNCRHKFTTRKKIMFGCPERKDAVIQYPSVFKVIEMIPNNQKEMRRKNPLFKGNISMNLRQMNDSELLPEERHTGSVIRTDLDNWGVMQHAKRLNVKPEHLKVFFQQYSHELVEEKMVIQPPSLAINYPDDVIESYRQSALVNSEEYVDPYESFDFEGLANAERAKRMRIV